MTKNENICHTIAQKPTETHSTRDAVETAIDTAKENKSTTWEGNTRSMKQIPKWQPKQQDSDSGHQQ
jgi:hypothetical protein